jgi:hypothetical protein
MHGATIKIIIFIVYKRLSYLCNVKVVCLSVPYHLWEFTLYYSDRPSGSVEMYARWKNKICKSYCYTRFTGCCEFWLLGPKWRHEKGQFYFHVSVHHESILWVSNEMQRLAWQHDLYQWLHLQFMYSWWWVQWAPETCTVILQWNKIETANCCISLDTHKILVNEKGQWVKFVYLG